MKKIKCEVCGKEIPKDQAYQVGEDSGVFVCEECYENECIECDRCGRINRVLIRERGGYGVDPYMSCDGLPEYGGRLKRRRNLLESGVF